jgi:hypothetical protein
MASTTDDTERLRLAVFEEWDPIGVYAGFNDHDDRRQYWDEYDNYLPEIARRLDQDDEIGLASDLAYLRTTLISRHSLSLMPLPQRTSPGVIARRPRTFLHVRAGDQHTHLLASVLRAH